ncbi:MAG: hypothetical protein ABID54_09455 [Pseudomonadota bacterium]
MKDFVVEFIETEEIRTPCEYHDSFQVRHDRPYVCLQRICCWVLKKVGAFNMGENITVRRHIIDTDSFIERIFRQNEGLHRRLGQGGEVLLIGSRDYAEIMGSDEFKSMVSFPVQYVNRNQIMGLTVHIIPWMSGMLVMPHID